MQFRNFSLFILACAALAACGHAGTPNVESTKSSSQNRESSLGGQNVTRKTSSSLPDLVTVEAKFDGNANPGVMQDDDGGTVTWLMANIPETRYSVPINDYLNLGAASSHQFISPLLNGCKLTTYNFDTVGPGNQFLNFGGRDAKGTKFCQNFLAAIAQNGLQMEFTDVPLLNGHGVTIKKVRVNVSNP
jgi:hypothetical protein